MRKMFLAGIFALAASTSLAQTDTAPEPVAPEGATPAPATPEAAAPGDSAATQQTEAGRPANLCQELLAFVQNPPEAAAPAGQSAAAEVKIPLSLERAEQLAEANDIAACQDAARKLRLAGVPMPSPLLALTALDLQYQTQANEVESPAQQTQPQQ
ncbi:hypothetical protein [Chelativorans alearense]|uniref:hypothetical protein n=1 Tax=Chelativorans alearense TaxID=2681495 RepID=UPI0013D14EE4|nr:hypothetical protein [Chelativorans alearense]